MLKLVPIRLGQVPAPIAPIHPFHVSVTDKRGNPWAGAQVTLTLADGSQAQGFTDPSGAVTFPNLSPGKLQAQILLPNGMKVSQPGSTESDIMIEVPVCAPTTLLTNTEIVFMVGGAALAGVGFLAKVPFLSAIGEIGVGGAIFSSIYRNSCSW